MPLVSGDAYDTELKSGTRHVVLLAYNGSKDIGAKHSARYKIEVKL